LFYFYYEQVVKVIWHKAASLPHTDGSVVFSRRRQCVLHLLRQSASAPYTAVPAKSLWVYRPPDMSWASPYFVRKIAPSQIGTWTPSHIMFLGPPKSTCRTYHDRFSRFCRAHGRDQQIDRPTDRQTDHTTPSVAIGRI